MAATNRLTMLLRLVAFSSFLAALALWVVPTSGAQGGGVVINEIVASNSQVFADGDGDFTDWVELYNPSPSAVDLTGWQISDDAVAWPFPAGTQVPGEGYLIVFASDKGSPDDELFPGPAGELHTNFKLGSGGERVTLINSSFVQEDEVTYPALETDQSYATDGAGGYSIRETADITPLAPNVVVEPTPTPTSPPVGTPSVVFNEVMASNEFTIADGAGDFEDWFELRNPTCETVDLSGWRVSDSSDGWDIPAGTALAPGDTVLLWASDKGSPDDEQFPGPAGELHTNFKLSSGGETMSLIDADGFLVADIDVVPLLTDEAWARDSNDVFGVVTGSAITPGDQNPGQLVPPCPAPTPVPTPEPTPVPTSVPTEVPTAVPTAVPTDVPTAVPTSVPTDVPTAVPTTEPTDVPTAVPTTGPTAGPTSEPTAGPTSEPTTGPTSEPTAGPTSEPTAGPTSEPTTGPTAEPTTGPTSEPTAGPTSEPTTGPTSEPTAGPTAQPTAGPTAQPTTEPTVGPSVTVVPTTVPTTGPTTVPTTVPTTGPTAVVSPSPTATPVLIFCPTSVIVNEVMPRNDEAALDGDGDSPDWIELRNLTDSAVDLTGWEIADEGGKGWPFPDGTSIEAEGFLIVWASDKGDDDNDDYPGPAGELHTDFRLSGSGDSVELIGPSGCTVDEISFGPQEQNNSFGVLRDGGLGTFYYPQSSFRSPNRGQVYIPIPECYSSGDPQIRMSRIVASNDGLLFDGDEDDPDFIELENYGLLPINLTLWQLSDSADTWTFPLGATIDAGEKIIVWASRKGLIIDNDYPGPNGEYHTSFRLSSGGEQVTLAEPSSCIVERVNYPELGKNQIFGFDETNNRAILVPGEVPGRCAGPGSVRFQAVMSRNDSFLADEDGDFEDWFEIANPSDEPVDLTGWVVTDTDGTWIMPEGLELEGGAKLVVWASGKDRTNPQAELHASFKLSGDGETLTIGSSLSCPVDTLTFPALEDDQAYRLGAEGEFLITGGVEEEPEPEVAQGDITIVGTCIAITELMAKNDSTIEDEDGEYGDWIELTNLSDDTIDLSGWELSDDKDTWTMPDGVEIEPGEFLVLWADEADRGGPDEELHTNFKLSGDGESLTLTDAAGEVAASISTFPELDDDEAFGLDDDGNWALIAAGEATPGEGPGPQECDFEANASGGSQTYEAEDDSAASDGESDQPDREGQKADEVKSDQVENGSGVVENGLAYTGSESGVLALLAQLLFAFGCLSAVTARIANRRYEYRSFS